MLIIIVALKCEFKSWWRVILGFHPICTFSEVSQHSAGGKSWKKNETECQNLSHLSLVFLYNNMGYYVNFILTTWDLQMKRYFGKTKILKYVFTLCVLWNEIPNDFYMKSRNTHYLFCRIKGFFFFDTCYFSCFTFLYSSMTPQP